MIHRGELCNRISTSTALGFLGLLAVAPITAPARKAQSLVAAEKNSPRPRCRASEVICTATEDAPASSLKFVGYPVRHLSNINQC